MPSEHLLPRRHEYTRVYTTVYPRVHNSIHACTQVRSKYLLSRARLYVYSLEIMPRIFRGGLRLPEIRSDTPEDPKAGVCERDHASVLVRAIRESNLDLEGYFYSKSKELYVYLR